MTTPSAAGSPKRLRLAGCLFIAGFFGLVTGMPVAAQTDSSQVVSVVDRFHGALKTGDSVAVMRFLAPDAVILEGGFLESRTDYASGHLSADMAFVAGVTSKIVERTVTIGNDAAWVSTMSDTDGTYNDREIHSRGAELVVLSRDDDVWRIRAIHWSSSPR